MDDRELFSIVAGVSLVLYLLPGAISATPRLRRLMRTLAAVVLGAGIVYALYRTVIWYGGGPA